MELTGRSLIGNRYTTTEGTRFKAFDPSRNVEVEPILYSAVKEDVEESVRFAKEAFKSYRTISGSVKAEFLEEIADQIYALGDTLIERAMLETALPKGRLEGERGRTMNQLKMFANLLREGSWLEASVDTAIPDRQPIPKPDIRKMLVPLGPVVVFGASNFPLAFSTAGGDTASALAAGNPVIVKAHSSHPGTSEMVASAILSAAKITNMPEGVFSHLHDSGFDAGQHLVSHPDVKAVGFTGSYAGGKALFDLAGKREEPIPVFAEMGSINPVFIFPGALEDRAAEIAAMYAGSITQGVGQFCTNPGLMVGLGSSQLETFSTDLDKAIQNFENASMLNSGIFSNYESRKKQVLQEEGISVLSGQENLEGSASNRPATTVATVGADSFIGNPNLHEEVFGPYSLLVNCSSKDDFLSIAEGLKGQLTITIMANKADLTEYREVIEKLEERTGRIIYNGVPTGVEVCPSMHHGGPFPATTDSRFTSVGTSAIKRFCRPLSYQSCPDTLLPEELRNENPLNIWRLVNSSWSKEEIQ